MHHPHAQDRWIKSLQQHAAALAFPDWQPGPDDWTSLHTSFTPDGKPITEVAVYRGRERVHYARISGEDLMRFWTGLLKEVPE
ncbi:hypothetical protein ABT294_00670 [Nonomuraea sp. NPDC000554]|uniref:hypothetical protein n=1 Tax=Nonomuraea sp. NPDC000554 TaxID=3154259 RepID=UPI0033312229